MNLNCRTSIPRKRRGNHNNNNNRSEPPAISERFACTIAVSVDSFQSRLCFFDLDYHGDNEFGTCSKITCNAKFVHITGCFATDFKTIVGQILRTLILDIFVMFSLSLLRLRTRYHACPSRLKCLILARF